MGSAFATYTLSAAGNIFTWDRQAWGGSVWGGEKVVQRQHSLFHTTLFHVRSGAPCERRVDEPSSYPGLPLVAARNARMLLHATRMRFKLKVVVVTLPRIPLDPGFSPTNGRGRFPC